MFKRVMNFFQKKEIQKQNQDEEKEKKKEEEYIPSQIEMLRFYKKFLHLDYKALTIKYFSFMIYTIVFSRKPFILVNIKNGLLEKDIELLKYCIIEFILLELLRQAAAILDAYYSQDSHKKMRESITKQILDHLFSLDYQYFEDNKITYISDVIKQGTEQICTELGYNKIFSTIDWYFYLIVQIYFVYSLSPKILLTMTCISLIFNLAISYLKSKKAQVEKESEKEEDFRDFAVGDMLNNIQVIKTFGTEKKEIEQMRQFVKENVIREAQKQKYSKIETIAENANLDMIKISIILQIFSSFMLGENVGQIVTALTELLDTTYCTVRITGDIIKLFKSQSDQYYQENLKKVGKVMKLFQSTPAIIQDANDNKNDHTLFHGDITFENITFSYPLSKDFLAQMNQKKHEARKSDQQQSSQSEITEASEEENSQKKDKIDSPPRDSSNQEQVGTTSKNGPSSQIERTNALENLSFTIKRGQFVAFVGTSGSGKSTIVKLIQRFYDPNSGTVLFDGQNIKDVSLNKLRRSIGLVSQEPTLFDNDIEYNITYGCHNDKYTQEELKQICEMSGVSEFVFDEKRFPMGLKTLVGSKGAKLSGGQKQRIAIARALIKKPKILILDEATSALDAESEHIVQTYIDQLVGYRGMTIIVVAHRLSTIIKSDKIFVMQKGEIRESGNHEELLAKNGIYKKLIHHQINFESQQINQK